jgi:hypothetical protein
MKRLTKSWQWVKWNWLLLLVTGQDKANCDWSQPDTFPPTSVNVVPDAQIFSANVLSKSGCYGFL